MGVQSEMFPDQDPPEEVKQKTGVIQKGGKFIAVIVIDGVAFELHGFKFKVEACELLYKAQHFNLVRGWSGLKIQREVRKIFKTK